uniref:Uncharacterized protein n=1 Tax=Anguilla anguilla TaxID=7936 RepID=A0A0E9QU31_ANGAN
MHYLFSFHSSAWNSRFLHILHNSKVWWEIKLLITDK